MNSAPPGAFDSVADGYDDVARSALGRHYRGRVHAAVERHLAPGSDVLDIGCGTGIDAHWLVTAGHRVVAVDASAEMVRLAEDRLHGMAGATVDRKDLDALDPSDFDRRFDLVLANFGVVNCSRDLRRFGRFLDGALDDSGIAVLVTMAPICPPELLHGLLTANRRLLGRRRSANRSTYRGAPVRYYSAHGLVDALGSGFRLEDARSLGVVLPTFEQRRLVEGRPRLLRTLGLFDRMLGSPAVGIATGDHHVAIVSRSGSERRSDEDNR